MSEIGENPRARVIRAIAESRARTKALGVDAVSLMSGPRRPFYPLGGYETGMPIPQYSGRLVVMESKIKEGAE